MVFDFVPRSETPSADYLRTLLTLNLMLDRRRDSEAQTFRTSSHLLQIHLLLDCCTSVLRIAFVRRMAFLIAISAPVDTISWLKGT